MNVQTYLITNIPINAERLIEEDTAVDRTNYTLESQLTSSLSHIESRFLISNSRLCSSVPNLTYFIYIYSAPGNDKNRDLIRHTWGRRDIFKNVTGRIAFILAAVRNASLQTKIIQENKIYGDIVQSDYIDAYINLTFKGISAIKWLSTYCLNSKFYIKADDDVLVNVFSLLPSLQRHVTLARRTFFCTVLRGASVQRSGNWKWIVTKQQFAPDIYPPYCNGPAWVVTRDLIRDLYFATRRVRVMPIEDVYSSGLLPQAIGDVYHFQDLLTIRTHPHDMPLSIYTDRTQPIPAVTVPLASIYIVAWEMVLSRLTESDKEKLTDAYKRLTL